MMIGYTAKLGILKSGAVYGLISQAFSVKITFSFSSNDFFIGL